MFAITGAIGSGKTTVTNHVVSYGFDEYAFANPLKKIAMCLGFTMSECYGSQEEKLTPNKFLGISAREFLQKFGTEIVRDQFPKIFPNMNLGESGSMWIRMLEIEIARRIDVGEKRPMLISDCRFDNEAEFLRKHGGVIIRIIRPGNKFGGAHSAHASEQNSQMTVDYEIINDGTIDDLLHKIDMLFATI